jgi:hypothetical protein
LPHFFLFSAFFPLSAALFSLYLPVPAGDITDSGSTALTTGCTYGSESDAAGHFVAVGADHFVLPRFPPQAVSWPAILESYGNSVDLLSADTKTLQLMMLDENLTILDVSNTSELFGIIVPRARDEDDKDDDDSRQGDESAQADLISPSQTIKRYEQMVYHQFLIDKSYAAVSFYCRLLLLMPIYPSV